MTTGTVNFGLEATLSLVVFDGAGQAHSIEVVIDTGFNGELTLPSTVVGALGLSWQLSSGGYLADGNYKDFDVYAAKILWDGVTRVVDVEEIGTTALLGTEMLRGCNLNAHFVAGGAVLIAAVP